MKLNIIKIESHENKLSYKQNVMKVKHYEKEYHKNGTL